MYQSCLILNVDLSSYVYIHVCDLWSWWFLISDLADNLCMTSIQHQSLLPSHLAHYDDTISCNTTSQGAKRCKHKKLSQIQIPWRDLFLYVIDVIEWFEWLMMSTHKMRSNEWGLLLVYVQYREYFITYDSTTIYWYYWICHICPWDISVLMNHG